MENILTKKENPNGLKLKYFVVRPEGNDTHARASRAALRTYSAVILKENEQLSKDIEIWVTKEEQIAKELNEALR